ncbi:hypothetical protein [uncultured Microscilla sp.]|uniref:hypothetical protein n=1 Tax=uncultured Microscilla sp. TaxID=432653 RepID=UPI00261A0E18|nr:hypothetical protein [uncultured Microscilla sp.]
MRKDKMNALRAQAMQEYTNFTGVSDKPLVNVVPQQGYSHYTAHDSHYNMAGEKITVEKDGEKASVKRIQENDRTYNLRIVNLDTINDQEVELFNAFTNLNEPNQGNNPDHINITSKGWDYRTILQSSTVNNFVIGSCRIMVGDTNQLTEDFTLTEKLEGGGIKQTPVDIASEINPEYNTDKVVDLKRLDWLIHGHSGIKFKLLKGQYINLIMKVKLRGNIANTLQGIPVVEAATSTFRK